MLTSRGPPKEEYDQYDDKCDADADAMMAVKVMVVKVMVIKSERKMKNCLDC